MQTANFAKSVLMDLLTSLLGLALLTLVQIYTAGWGNLRTSFLGTAVLFLFVGFLRGRSLSAYSGFRSLVLILPSVIVFYLMSDVSHVVLLILAFISYGSSLGGIYARHNWAGRGRSRSLVILGGTLALVAIMGAIGAPALATRLNTRIIDTVAADFTVTRLEGVIVDSSEMKGRVAVLDFWATWCPPCWQQFPQLERLYLRYQSNPDVVFLAIDVRSKGENPEKARRFILSGGYNLPVAFDDNDAVFRLHAEGYPHLLILDKSGHVRLVHTGYDSSEHFVENISDEIDRLLSE